MDKKKFPLTRALDQSGSGAEKLTERKPTEVQLLKWQNQALIEALQYLVDTKHRKDTIGKDSIYMQRQKFGWIKAKNLLEEIKENETEI